MLFIDVTSINLPDSVTSIGNEAFVECTGLTSITIPPSVTLVDENAFGGCTGLTEVILPDSVTSIGNDVFAGCTNIQAITAPPRFLIRDIFPNTHPTAFTNPVSVSDYILK